MTLSSQNSTATDGIGELLGLLGLADNEVIEVCWQRGGGRFEFCHTEVGDAQRRVGDLADEADVWFSINPVDPPERGRGKVENVTRCAALAIDLDEKTGGVADGQTAEAIVTELQSALGEYPVAVVSSGHGWHVYWALDIDDNAWVLDTEPKRVAAQSIYRRFHRLAAHIAELHGAGLDNISDLSRILRAPGTVNRKDPETLVAVEMTTEHPYGGGAALTLEQVDDALRAYGVPETDEDRDTVGEVIAHHEEWQFGEETTGYVASMVRGWADDVPGEGVGRHAWLVSQSVRLACAHRLARITEGDHAQARDALRARFGELLRAHGDVRKPTPGEVAGAASWGVWRASRKTDAQAAVEVGGETAAENETGARPHATPPEVFLSPEFFESRASLRHIRDAAIASFAAPDAVLAAALARVSANIPPSVRVNTGIMSPIPMHLYAVLASVSGAGKSSAADAAKETIRIRFGWPNDPMCAPSRLLLPEGEPYVVYTRTGEGIAEAFWGERTATDAKGKVTRTRSRVRSNVLLDTDEGSGVVKMIADPQSTVGETLRSGWSGKGIGQSNAEATKRRPVHQGTYTLALITGMQVSVLGEFLTPAALSEGTPQRFVFAWCKPNPAMVTREVISATTDPGALDVVIPGAEVVMTEELRDLIREERTEEYLSDDPSAARSLKSQRLAAVARIAGLLAILDGRGDPADPVVVNRDDWALAEEMFATSCAIADHAVEDRRSRAAQAKRSQRASDNAAAVESAEAMEHPERTKILGRLAEEGGGWVKWSGTNGLRMSLSNSENRARFDAALDELTAPGGRVETKEPRKGSVLIRLVN